MPPEVDTEVALRDVSLLRFLVAKVPGEVEKSLHVPGDQERENRTLSEIDAFVHEAIEVEPAA